MYIAIRGTGHMGAGLAALRAARTMTWRSARDPAKAAALAAEDRAQGSRWRCRCRRQTGRRSDPGTAAAVPSATRSRPLAISTARS